MGLVGKYKVIKPFSNFSEISGILTGIEYSTEYRSKMSGLGPAFHMTCAGKHILINLVK